MMDVSSAVDTIRDNLQEGFLNDVSAGELRENTEVLEKLSPQETNDAISQMSDQELEHWGDEIYAGKFLAVFGSGGLSADERSDLYNNLGRDLEPAQLERVYQSLGDESRQAEFIGAVATHASDTNKAGLVERLADQTTDKPPRLEVGLGSSTSHSWDQDAAAVSTLIASINDVQAMEQAFNHLDDTQLESVLDAGIQQSRTSFAFAGGTSTHYSFDTQGLTSLLETAANSNNPDLKARVFELGSRQIEQIRDTDMLLAPNPSADARAGEVVDALSTLLQSDTVGVVTSLEKGSGILSSRSGNGFSDYSAELIRQEQFSTITDTLAQLQSGNDLNHDASAYLAQSTTDSFGNRDFQNASNLGFFVGSVREGIGAIQTDAQEQADTLNTIFGLGLGGVGMMVPGGQILSKGALVLAKPLSKEFVDSVTTDLAGGHTSLGDAIEQLALPDDVYSSDVTGPFGDAIDAVVRN